MVVIFLSLMSPTMVWHERTASPLTCTVQAPHSPAPQPNLVPVICNSSRMTHSSGVSFAASTDTVRPLMVSLGIGFFPARRATSLTAKFGLVVSSAPTGSMPATPTMIASADRRNGIWNRGLRNESEIRIVHRDDTLGSQRKTG